MHVCQPWVALPVVILTGYVCATTVTNDTGVAANKSFDYVIIGAGLSGITVANILSEKGFSTLLIEAGPDARWNSEVYNAEDRVQHDPYCNWLYPAYDENGTALAQAVDAGACVGGSTSINGMDWIRPTATEVDKLEALGNPGWNWESLEPVRTTLPGPISGPGLTMIKQYMTAIERNIAPDEVEIQQGAGLDPYVHGFHGAVNVSFPIPMRIPTAVALYKETLPLAFPGLIISNDLSNRSADHTVSASTSWTLWHNSATGENLRSSAADSLLWAPDQQRERLTVLTNHKVDKVLFTENLTATGVVLGVMPGSNVPGSLPGAHTVYVTKEVILSGGALASASILERSGVGDASVLQAVGVRPLVDLPGVGCNLVDQPGTGAAALVAAPYQNDTAIIDDRILFAPEITLVNIRQIWPADSDSYYQQLTSQNNLEARAKALVSARAAVNIEGAKAILNATIDLMVDHHFPVAEFASESYPTVLEAIFWPLMPLSRGHVHINSLDPFEDQIIVPRFLTDDFDQQIATAITRRAGALFSSGPIADIVADAYYDPALGPNSTDAEYLAWYSETAFGASHWMGSTAMLPRELGGVVDSELYVYSTKGLRVVDAGILPFEITSHPMSLLYAVAQKAAALIVDAA